MTILEAGLKRVPEPIENIMDYVDEDGALHRGVTVRTVMVRDGDDLEELPDDYMPGTVAFTAGRADEWMKGADGTWTRMTGADDSEGDGE